ncbi:MAG: hypothetical protein ACR2K1_08935 [Saprospiraceae bacterium]
MREQVSQLKAVPLIAAAARTTDSTRLWVDRSGYEAVSILLEIGAGGITFDTTNKVEFVLYESDASDGTGATAVAEADLMGVTGSGATGIVKSLIAAHATGAAYMYGYRGAKRYIGLLADFSGTHGVATPMAASAILGKPRNSPTS